mmetsp:Transcript_66076/g.214942  ORF Transcript_66076/g.214942 Transcript_66076/m.214942 type:complete len:194 (-) Transcript_66076:376-957(-)
MGASCPCHETKQFVDEGCVEGEQQTAIVQQMAALCAKEFAADIAAAPRKTVADVAEATQEVAEAAPETAAEVQEIVVAAAKQGTEVVCSAIDVAVAAITGTMVVGFVTENGEVKKVDFKTKKVGFEMAMSGGGCCGPAGQAQVAVKKIDTKGQAETLGVKLGWRVKSISGTEVSGLKPAHKLLEESVAKLSEA